MPVLRRRKSEEVATTRRPRKRKGVGPSPRWFVVLMLALFLVGIVWLVVYYLVPSNALMEPLGGWNLAIGFGVIIVGMGMATRWR